METGRGSARVGFSNELGYGPWSNGEFKKRNSTDPSVTRGCGSGDVDTVKPTITHVFATNDVPKYLDPTKGSEEDRTLILYLPNRFKAGGEAPTSPRTFTKDLGLEEEVATNNFALGLLLNLIQVRKDHKESLASAINVGTTCSNYWRAKWVLEWNRDLFAEALPITEGRDSS